MSGMPSFQGLGIRQRLILIALSFTLPIAVLVMLFVKGINDDIHFARMERYGIAYQRPLEALLLAVPDAGDPDVAARIDTLLDALDDADRRLGPQLQFTAPELRRMGRESASAAAIRTRWQQLAASVGRGTPEDVAALRGQLMQQLRLAITHVGDKSNLILDPDLDSYYLMDLTLLALPQTHDRLAAILREGHAALRGEASVTPAQRMRLAIHRAQLEEADLTRIASGAETSLAEDGMFYGPSATLQVNLPLALSAYREATTALLTRLQQLGASAPDAGTGLTAAAFLEAGRQAQDASAALWEVAITELDALLQQRMRQLAAKRTFSLLLSFAALLLAGLLVWRIARSILMPLAHLRTTTLAVADRWDLTQRVLVNGRSELGEVARAFNTMVENLSEIMRQVQDAGLQLAGASSQLRVASQQQATGATQQSTTVVEITATIKELAQTAARIADNALHLSRTSESAMAGIQTINERIGVMAKRMVSLGERSQNIGTITTLIDDLADQTNLLALNAAIEAARAGEAGRGFAVVASEIRKLAERSTESTQGIRQLIAEIQGETQAVVLGVEASAKAAQQGLDQMGDAFSAIKEISLATSQQKLAAEQVVEAIRNVDDVAKQFTDSTRQTAASAEAITNLAGRLQDGMKRFTLAEGRRPR